MTRILFLAANPLDSPPLWLEEEIRAIDEKMRQAEFRDQFDLRQHWAVSISDLQEYLLRHEPDIVHFSGRGSKSSEIILKDKDGNGFPISVEALSNLFSVLKGNIRCVVLNTCYSEAQALAIARHIGCVVGMSKAITEQAAISFASSFYRALVYGRDVETAYKLGCSQIDINDLGEENTPKLLAFNANPCEVFFARARENETGTIEPTKKTKTRTEPNVPVRQGKQNEEAARPLVIRLDSSTTEAKVAPGASSEGVRLTIFAGIVFAAISLLWANTQMQDKTSSNSEMISPRRKSSGSANTGAPPPEAREPLSPNASHLEKALSQAESEYQNEQYNAAINECLGILAANPDQPLANAILGQSYYSTGDTQGLKYLTKAIKLGAQVSLPINHHHNEGVFKWDDGLCPGQLNFSKGKLEFRSNTADLHSFNAETDKIFSVNDQSHDRGRINLKIDIQSGGLSTVAEYNFYPPPAALRQQLTRTKVFCESPDCQSMARVVYQVLEFIKK